MVARIFLPFLLLSAFTAGAQQKVVSLYNGAAPGSEKWSYPEREDTAMHTSFYYNVSRPTLTVCLPDPAIATGTGVVICPGGGFSLVMKGDEGSQVARWLNEKGIAAFILKYRTLQIFSDKPFEEMFGRLQKSDFGVIIKPTVALEVADGKEAIRYVRTHAGEYHLSPSRIGIIGFSAGGMVAVGCLFNYSTDERPDFAASVYGYILPDFGETVAGDAPPVFITAATDDGLGLAANSVALYSKLIASKHTAELHIYQKGGHGFALHKQNIPTDTWTDRFTDWLKLNGWLSPTGAK